MFITKRAMSNYFFQLLSYSTPGNLRLPAQKRNQPGIVTKIRILFTNHFRDMTILWEVGELEILIVIPINFWNAHNLVVLRERFPTML